MLLSGQVNRLIWLEAYNAGVPVLCVVNLSGGNQLDETNLISPTTIGAASNTTNVIYSASAVAANSPYHLVGFTDVIFTTGTGWSSPTLVQPAGGNALAAMSSLGYGQTYQSVTRTSGVTYYNTTGKSIFYQVNGAATAGASANCSINIGGVTFMLAQGYSSTGSGTFAGSVIIPPGVAYTRTDTNVSAIGVLELR
jgi:hypothetical protein